MNYELAKKLKDAGYKFSRIEPDNSVIRNVAAVDYWKHGFVVFDGFAYKIPTLSELVEACGGDFDALVNAEPYWYANNLMGKREYGSTPEEAVANLWLALNTEKDVTRQSLNP